MLVAATLTTYNPMILKMYVWYGTAHVPSCGVPAACTGFFDTSLDGACAHLCWSGNDAYNLFDNTCGIGDCNTITWNDLSNQTTVPKSIVTGGITINGISPSIAGNFYVYTYTDQSIEAQTVPIVINGCTLNIKKP